MFTYVYVKYLEFEEEWRMATLLLFYVDEPLMVCAESVKGQGHKVNLCSLVCHQNL